MQKQSATCGRKIEDANLKGEGYTAMFKRHILWNKPYHVPTTTPWIAAAMVVALLGDVLEKQAFAFVWKAFKPKNTVPMVKDGCGAV